MLPALKLGNYSTAWGIFPLQFNPFHFLSSDFIVCYNLKYLALKLLLYSQDNSFFQTAYSRYCTKRQRRINLKINIDSFSAAINMLNTIF
jgi:hypothetical protein